MPLFGSRRPLPAGLFAAMGAIVVAGFAVATYQTWSNDNALRDRGQQTTARVVNVSAGKNSRVEGDEAPGPRAKVGDEIPIVYDPRDPTSDVRDARASDNHTVASLSLAATILAAVAVPIATWALIRAKRRESAA
jgi:hypothetical protein